AFQLGAVSVVPYVELDSLEIVLARPLGLAVQHLELEWTRLRLGEALSARGCDPEDGLSPEARAVDRGLVSVVGTELQDPIGALLGWVELLELTGGFEGENRRIVDGLIAASERLDRFAEDCVELGRWCAGERAINVGPCQIEEVVWAAVDRARAYARDRSVRVDVVELTPAQVRGDGEILTDVVRRVIESAIDTAGPNRVVRVRGFGASSRYRLEVDTSTEVLVDDEPTSSRDLPGGRQCDEGLKIALARVALESHDGELSIVGKPEGGAAFQIHLPVRASQVARTLVPKR
ncbi:MAG: HAMP domain-containing histidine kinase, partial [Planctomycetes bacterium]|nr:HAMP domain-containing histidine kinase [Planctomycetota bacterium]